jgi:hypothetical protein
MSSQPSKNERGSAVLTVIFVLLILTGIGYTLSDMMTAKVTSLPETLDSSKAFYLSEAGIQYADKYLNDLFDWGTAVNDTKNLGEGSFSVTFSDYTPGTPESINVTSVGTAGMAQRVLKGTFERD